MIGLRDLDQPVIPVDKLRVTCVTQIWGSSIQTKWSLDCNYVFYDTSSIITPQKSRKILEKESNSKYMLFFDQICRIYILLSLKGSLDEFSA